MIRTIQCGDKVLTYELCRKKVKNINLRIRSDGSVTVSASPSVSVKSIEDFILSKADYILSAIDKLSDREERYPRLSEFADGEKFSIFGEQVTLHIEKGKKSVTYDKSVLCIKCHDESSCKKIATEWLNAYCRETVEKICREYYPHFKEYCPVFPTLRFRKMTSRWGSCQTRNKVITFNYDLIRAPLPFVEYVVLHELAHFVEPNHSSRFYSVVSRLMPDWKKRDSLMKY